MKKNFLKVAALLIAAMLMVVSCTQEVAPKNEDNGLVKVSLNTSTARSALTYSSDLKIENVTYRYKLTAKWTPGVGDDAIVGETKANTNGADENGFVTFTDDTTKTTQELDYVSQGLWQVDVIGKIGEKDVLSGSTQVYLNKNNGNVTVYVTPIDTQKNAQISLDIAVNDHDNGSHYKLYFSIQDVSGNAVEVGGNREFAMTKGDPIKKDEQKTGYSSWTGSMNNLKPGYYRVTVTMKNEKSSSDVSVVGGITKGVLLFANDTTAKLTGSVNSMDFVNGTLNVVYPTVTLGLTSTATASVGVNTEITYTATPGNVTGLPSDYVLSAPEYAWYENGSKVVPAGNNVYTDNDKKGIYKTSYSDPGYKTVTCVVTYTLSIPNGESDNVAFTVQADAGTTVKINPSTT